MDVSSGRAASADARPFRPAAVAAGLGVRAEVDGFRAIVRPGEGFEVRSRRGWTMTDLLRELRRIPVDGVFVGELVSLDREGRPSFERV